MGFGKWRMYPNFRTTRVPSGRLSCSDPNLLAIPTRTERGKDIRKGFITDEGWCFVSVDLSQIEMRVAAHRSQDPNLMRIYEHREDIYSDFATTAFKLTDSRYKDDLGKWKYPTVDKMHHRNPAKTFILASLYRVTASGLLAQMPIICANCNKPVADHTCKKFTSLWTEGKCQDLINSFYMRYPGLLRMQKIDDTTVRKNALIWDAFGRILQVAAVRSVHDYVVSAALREAGNFPLQSMATGILKVAEAEINDDLEQGNTLEVCKPLLVVHDEILSESREDVARDVGELMSSRMENAVPLSIPIVAEAVTASSWGLLEK
jgi:DNA polymerase-1